MHVMDRIREKVKADKKRIVLSEGMDKRMIHAAAQAAAEGLAEVTLLATEKQVEEALGEDRSALAEGPRPRPPAVPLARRTSPPSTTPCARPRG